MSETFDSSETWQVRLDGATKELSEARTAFTNQAIAWQKDAEANDKRMRSNYRMVRVALIVAFIAVLAGITGIVVGGKGIQSQHEANQNTLTARIGSCNQSNAAQITQIRAEKKEADEDVIATEARDRNTADHIAPPPHTPEIEAKVQEYLASQNKITEDQAAAKKIRIDQEHVLRVCTPEGIAQYLKNLPAILPRSVTTTKP